MGVKYAEGVILDVEGMWHESKIRVPIVCLLSMGSDPTMTIDGLAKKHQIGQHKSFIKFYFISNSSLVLYNFRMSYNFYGSGTRSACQKIINTFPN